MRGLAIVLVLSACAEESRDVVEIGVVWPAAIQVELPATARVGDPVNVLLRTIGDGCTQHERTDVELRVERADITPYDRRVYQSLCDDSAGSILHDARLSFPSPGVKTIVVHGLEFSPTDHGGDDVPGNIEVVRTINVE